MKLADLCKKFNGKLSSEIEAIKKETPNYITPSKCPSEIKVYKLISGLNAATSKEEIESLANFDTNKQNRLEQLQNEKNKDSAELEKDERNKQIKFKKLCEIMKQLKDEVTYNNLEELKKLTEKFLICKEASEKAAAKIQNALPGTRSDSWKILWNAVETYSVEQAYKEKEFPVTGNEACCVLCQQKLDNDAKERMQNFHSFIKNEIEHQKNAERKLEKFKDDLKKIQFEVKGRKLFLIFVKRN